MVYILLIWLLLFLRWYATAFIAEVNLFISKFLFTLHFFYVNLLSKLRPFFVLKFYQQFKVFKNIFPQFSRRKKHYEPVKHSQVMIYLFFAHSKVETVFEWVKCVKKCQRKVMAAAAAVHYSILRSLTHSLRSATDIHGGKKSGLHNTHNFGLKTITLKYFAI